MKSHIRIDFYDLKNLESKERSQEFLMPIQRIIQKHDLSKRCNIITSYDSNEKNILFLPALKDFELMPVVHTEIDVKPKSWLQMLLCIRSLKAAIKSLEQVHSKEYPWRNRFSWPLARHNFVACNASLRTMAEL